MQSHVDAVFAPHFLSGCSIIGDQSESQLPFSLEIKMKVWLGKKKEFSPVFIIFHTCVSFLIIFISCNLAICTLDDLLT